MRTVLQPADGDHYQRPQQRWTCGLAEEGAACPVGPDACGNCPAAAACHPTRDGDRWLCNRSPLRGGPCPQGPSPEGTCATVYRCAPIRSLRSRRGQLALGCALATLGALTMTLSANWRQLAIAPGPLSAPHAQLMHPSRQTERCGACHAAGNQSVWGWLGHSSAIAPHRVTQTELCLACHDKLIDPRQALAAHTSSRWQVDETTMAKRQNASLAGSRRRDPAEPIACAACHREHQGTAHRLSSLDDRSCQACHLQQFTSFATDHPDFDQWPYLRRTPIQFDHASHEGKHFAEKRQTFDCNVCHVANASGERQTTLAYDATCGACHDESLQRSWPGGIELLTLPELDVELLTESGRFAVAWPEEATGDFDGGLPAINRLLLASDPLTAHAMEKLGWQFNAFDVDIDDAEQVEALADLMSAQRRLVDELAEQTQQTIASRMEAVLERTVTPSELSQLAGRLSPDTIAAYRNRWFATPSAPPSAETPSADPQRAAPNREQWQRQVAAGGWLRDELARSVAYRPQGHADPWVRAWIDVMCEASRGAHGALARALLGEMLKPTAPGLCGSCHSVEYNAAGELFVAWQTATSMPRGREFTHFDHGPHLTQPQLRDCRTCHTPQASPSAATSYATTNPHDFVAGFAPLSRTVCSGCHVPQAAGDRCTQCHRYHGP